MDIKYPTDFYMESLGRFLYTSDHWFLFDKNNYDCLTFTADKELIYMYAIVNNFDDEPAFIEIWDEYRKHIFEQYINTDLEKYYYSPHYNINVLYQNHKKLCLVHYAIMKLQDRQAFIEQFSNKPYKMVTERTSFIKQNKTITKSLLADLNNKLERNQVVPSLKGEPNSVLIEAQINDTAYFPYTDLAFEKILDIYLFLKSARNNEFTNFMKDLKGEYGHIIKFSNKEVTNKYFSDFMKGVK